MLFCFCKIYAPINCYIFFNIYLFIICDTQNNNDVNHIKNDAKKPDNQLYHNLSKDTRQKNDSQFNTCTKNGSNSGDTQQQQEKVLRPPKKSAFIVGDSMIKK